MFFLVTTPYYFCQKLCCIGIFVPVLYRSCTGFTPVFWQKSKKYANFLQFFLVVYQQVRRKLKKKLLETLDKILNCCIFASLFDIKQDNRNNNKITITLKTKEK